MRARVMHEGYSVTPHSGSTHLQDLRLQNRWQHAKYGLSNALVVVVVVVVGVVGVVVVVVVAVP